MVDRTPDRLYRLQEIAAKRTNRVRFLFENPSNTNNVWAAVRTLDSFGVQNVDIVMEVCEVRQILYLKQLCTFAFIIGCWI
jgi:hypothetical protein